MRRIGAIIVILLMLPALFACSNKSYPQIEDSLPHALHWGNAFAAEQGEWVAMRSIDEGWQGILLYNKKEQKGRILIEGEYRDIGLLNNKVFYRSTDGKNALYCFDLSQGKAQLLAESVARYQVWEGKIYYITTDITDLALHTHDLETGARGVENVSYRPDAFWFTEYGLYYFNKTLQTLMVLPRDAKMDRVLFRADGAVLDLSAIEGARIVFLQQGADGINQLCSYNPADKKMIDHYEGPFDTFVYLRKRVVMVKDSIVCSIDLQTNAVYSWGALKGAAAPQLLSDCVIFYNNENQPVIQSYPKAK